MFIIRCMSFRPYIKSYIIWTGNFVNYQAMDRVTFDPALALVLSICPIPSSSAPNTSPLSFPQSPLHLTLTAYLHFLTNLWCNNKNCNYRNPFMAKSGMFFPAAIAGVSLAARVPKGVPLSTQKMIGTDRRATNDHSPWNEYFIAR